MGLMDAANNSPGQLVTLISAENLVQADMLSARLKAAGIEAFLPDEFLMHSVGFNLNTYGYVRVQVPQRDLEKARELLTTSSDA